jgi:REP element-mobilizing transposase RayT
MPDHVHLFFGMRPTQSLSDLMRDLKSDSSKWINEKKIIRANFSWQEGYGGFSYSKSHVNNVIDYIKNQQEHHRKKTFIEEYFDFLNKFDIPYDERYVFKPINY